MELLTEEEKKEYNIRFDDLRKRIKKWKIEKEVENNPKPRK